MATQATPAMGDESAGAKARRERQDLEAVVAEIAQLLEASEAVVNRSKLQRDLLNRERKATTAIIPGVAIPHVRTLQVRRFVMGFARADADGIPFGAVDGVPTRLFLPLVSPPYDDRTYLLVYRELAQLLSDEEVVAQLLAAQEVQEVFNILRRFYA